jgi:hypothetical protein
VIAAATIVVAIEVRTTGRRGKISVTDVTTDQRYGREASRQIHLQQNVHHEDLGTKIDTQNLSTAKPVKRLKHRPHRDQIAHRFVASLFDVGIKNVNQRRKS